MEEWLSRQIKCGLALSVLLLTVICVITVFKMLWTHEAQSSESTTNFDHCDDAFIVVNKSTDNTKPHSICFLPQYQHQRKCFFLRAYPRAWHIHVSSVVWTVIDNSILANQIVRLVAVVVNKINFMYSTTIIIHVLMICLSVILIAFQIA